MRAVSRFESNLLRIVQFVLGQVPRGEALPLLLRGIERPPCLSRTAVELLQATLAKGCVRLLARGGWRRERFLRGETPVDGQLWERTPPHELALSFSRHSLEFLFQLTAKNSAETTRGWGQHDGVLTVGDQFLVFLAYRAVRGTEIAEHWSRRQAFAGHPLCQLAFPGDFTDSSHTANPDWATWIGGAGSWILESLQHELAEHWCRAERSKAAAAAPVLGAADGGANRLRAQAATQERVLNRFLDALEAHQRRDLARFLLIAAQRLLRERQDTQAWIIRLDGTPLTMSQRRDVYEATSVFFRALERLYRWQREAMSVGYWDEGYAASQMWKADWERLEGQRSCDAAREMLRQLDPLRATAHGEAPAQSVTQ